MEDKIVQSEYYDRKRDMWIYDMTYQLNFRITVADRDLREYDHEKYTKEQMKYRLKMEFEKDAIEHFLKDMSAGTFCGMHIKMTEELDEKTAVILMHPAMYARLHNTDRIFHPYSQPSIKIDESQKIDKEIKDDKEVPEV